ncbi:terminase small subunit [Pseudomonas alabamensis]|uniref:terminase small subunit n=1 Tax=Pseudomonas alabamensis TaxID=3064349 RepID=UPI000745BB98|nr:terminase [Pseudomonas monteilii]
MALTPKKRAFIEALREGASNRDAAIAAGCPEKTASAAGSRLAKDPDVIAELHKLEALGLLPPVVKSVKADVKAPPAKPPKPAKEPAPVDPDPADAAEPPEAEPAGFDLAQVLLHRDPKDFLLSVMNDLGTEPKLRVDAAKALMPFVHQRKGEGGKKEQAKQKAAEVGAGKFGTRRGPLKAVK